MFLDNLFKRVGLNTLSFNRYKMAQSLLGRSCILCFETVLGMNKSTSTPIPTQKKTKYLFLDAKEVSLHP